MKKQIAGMVALVLSLTMFSACGTQENSTNTYSTTVTTTTSVTTKTTTTTPTATTTVKQNLSRDDVFDNCIFYLISSNSVGGLQYIWADKYLGTKTVNYYTLYFEMYNSVDDPAYDEIKNQSTYTVKTVGPVESGEYMIILSRDNPDVYCNICSKLIITKIVLEYADGTTDTVDYGWSVTKQDATWSAVFNSLKTNEPEFYNALTRS
jgi:ABC-type enterochelin transport system substrate-binding protein